MLFCEKLKAKKIKFTEKGEDHCLQNHRICHYRKNRYINKLFISHECVKIA